LKLKDIAVLADSVRRALYQHVAASSEPVSREQAADALDIAPHTARFHLDKLASAGLLRVEYRRLSGRTGPGAGRPAKLYKRSEREISLSIPERRYDLAGEVLAEAADRANRDDVPIIVAVTLVARAKGRDLAAAATPASEEEQTATPGDELAQAAAVLAEYGYEPQPHGDELCLANCPFDRLATKHTELVCGMNLALIDGVLDGLQLESVHARLHPQPDFCCVALNRTGRSEGP
jgi:predicted ArsR family transcriptional regulator